MQTVFSQEELDELLHSLSEGDFDHNYEELDDETKKAIKAERARREAQARSLQRMTPILDYTLHSFLNNVEKEFDIENVSLTISIKTPKREEPINLTMTF